MSGSTRTPRFGYDLAMPLPGIRLQKLLSAAGVASRRAAERLIVEGRVTVNGQTVTALGVRARSEDDIRVDGVRLKGPEKRRYILLNKPRGYVTTRSDPERRPTIMDLLRGVTGYLYPVGRLDFESEGLLLLTNDGELAARLMHPRHGIPRTYEALVLGVPRPHELDRLARGVTIEGRRTAPATVRLLRTMKSARGPQAVLAVTVREGRKRQVRHMCEAIGHPVVHLRRVSIGPLSDRKLEPGQFRDLQPREVTALKKAVAAGSGTQARRRADGA
jgi:pseudouridine synthase